MNMLHIAGVPHSVTDEELADIFSVFGTVVSARTIKDQHGNNTGTAIVEMYHAGDVQEVLSTSDTIAIRGKRPHIWKPAYAVTLTDLLRRQDSGIFLGQNKAKWYVYELRKGRLRWCH